MERLENFEYLTQGKDKIIVQNVRGHDMSANFFLLGFSLITRAIFASAHLLTWHARGMRFIATETSS